MRLFQHNIMFNTTIALNASVLLVKAVPEPGPGNSAFHLPAHHVTSPDTSRGETQHARLKSVQSQNAPSLFPCAKSLRRRISSQIGWLTQNPEPSSQPADPRDGAREGLDAPAHRSTPGLSSHTGHTRSRQRQVDISRQTFESPQAAGSQLQGPRHSLAPASRRGQSGRPDRAS